MNKTISIISLGLLFISSVFLFQQEDVHAQNQLSPEFETALEKAQENTPLSDSDFALDATPPEAPPELSFWGKTKKFFSDVFTRTPEPEVREGPLRVFEGIDRPDRLTNPLDSDTSIVDATPPEDPQAFEDDPSFFQKVGGFFSGLFNGSSEREETVLEVERMLEDVRENQEEFQRERDAALEQAQEEIKQTKKEIEELQRRDSTKLVVPPVVTPETILPPEQVLVPTPVKEYTITCGKDYRSVGPKTVGGNTYCIVPRPCSLGLCPYRVWGADGSYDTLECLDDNFLTIDRPMCAELGI